MTDSPGRFPPPEVPGLTGLTVLARGGYATVYRAVQSSVGREVAVKVENRTLDSEREQRRFLREARAAGRMSGHPHVVDLFDCGVTVRGHPYLIMELCEASYAERMRASPLSAAEAREIGVKIADALADAHHLGVLHRDVKPANILLTRFGEPALADFGLAVLAEIRDSSITLEVLTPAYAAPEMFRHGAPTPAVDVYALCATLYTVMRGKPPRWRDDQDPSLVTLMDMFTQPIPDLPGVPAALIDVLRAGMANDPAARPSAVDLRDWLANVSIPGPAQYRPWPATTPPGTTPPPAGPPATVDPAPDNDPTVPNQRRRRLGRVWGGLVALSLLAAGGGIWYAAGGPGSPSTPPAQAAGSPSASPQSTEPAGDQVGCALAEVVSDGRCPTSPECFDAVTVSGGVARAEPVSCAGRHTWEVFATGELPSDVDSVRTDVVKTSDAVRKLCSTDILLLASLKIQILLWRIAVLPPTPAAFAEGDRTFRCLAGKGPNKLTGVTLGTG